MPRRSPSPTAGGEVTATDATGDTTTYFFDDRGLIVKVIDAAGHATSTSHYDANFNLTQTTDSAGQITPTRYDTNGNLISTTDPLGHTTQLYLHRTVQPPRLGHRRQRQHHPVRLRRQRQPASTTYADGTRREPAPTTRSATSSARPTGAAKLIAVHLRRGRPGHSPRPTPTARSTAYTYDAHGNLVSTTDSTGTTTLHLRRATIA